LRREGVTATDVDATRVVVSTALLVLALLLGVAFRAVNFYALLLLLLTGPLVRLLARARSRG
jgi:hypothetical protein